jgi:acyl-CoA reductase-like NAD-dependent aldehyde dehydrogenase
MSFASALLLNRPLTQYPTKSLGRIVVPSKDDVNTAIDNAHAVFESGEWSKAPTLHRSRTLFKLARLLEQKIPEYAVIETMQTGRTVREMNVQLGRLPEWL